MRHRLAFALLAFAALTSAPAGAQVEDAPELAAIDSLITAGDLELARARLDAWLDAHPPGSGGAPPGARAWALFLKGRLAPDWAGAEDALLSVVLGYPTASHAPEALLLLGKGLIAAASTGRSATAAIRAASYLERLVSDYPGNPLRSEGQLWLARARAGAGRPDAACALLRQARTSAADPGIARAMDDDMTVFCAASPSASRAPPDSPRSVTARQPAAAAGPDSTRPAREPTASPPGDYSIQIAAMRSRDGAGRLASELTRAGFDARVVDVEGSALVRVRVGVFSDARSAEERATQIRARGFTAVVVDDVAREHRSS